LNPVNGGRRGCCVGTTRIFLLKFTRGPSKYLLVIDSGFRVHLTQLTRETSPMPSAFMQKLRKYLRTRRVTYVSQLGINGILWIQFSDGLYSLYLEFFAGGNIILTNANGTITRERIVKVLTYAVDTAQERLQQLLEERPTATAGEKKFQRKRKKVDSALKWVLSVRLSEFLPVLIGHTLFGVGVDPVFKAADMLASAELLVKVVEGFGEVEKIIRELTVGEGTMRGYIVAKKPQDVKDEPKEEMEEEREKENGFVWKHRGDGVDASPGGTDGGRGEGTCLRRFSPVPPTTVRWHPKAHDAGIRGVQQDGRYVFLLNRDAGARELSERAGGGSGEVTEGRQNGL